MSDPLTLQFGPWQPDLQNVPVQIPFYPSLADPIPAADCLNVYYSDGAYRSIPAPAAIGPALGFQALNAFSWYDYSTGEEYVFAAGNGQISALIGGAWEALPIGSEPAFNISLTQGFISVFAAIIGGTWSGSSALVLKGNGTVTLGGASSTNWYSPTTTGIGAGYWINITRTGGTAGTNFSAAQGAWVNIGSTSLTIGLSGGSGSINASGTYQIATDALGAHVVASGTISLTQFKGQTDTYNTAGTFTETIPAGALQVVVEVWGASGGGGSGPGTLHSVGGSGGGSGGYSKRTITLSSANWGETIAVVIGSLGAGGVSSNGGAGGLSKLSSGSFTMTTQTANGGGGGGASGGTPGAGGTASGGTTNTTGNAGAVGTSGGPGSGGASIMGVNGTGSRGGNGGFSNGAAGGNGLAVLKYT